MNCNIIIFRIYSKDFAHAKTRRSSNNTVHELAGDDHETDATFLTPEREPNIGFNILLLINRQYFIYASIHLLLE